MKTRRQKEVIRLQKWIAWFFFLLSRVAMKRYGDETFIPFVIFSASGGYIGLYLYANHVQPLYRKATKYIKKNARRSAIHTSKVIHFEKLSKPIISMGERKVNDSHRKSCYRQEDRLID